MRSVLIYYPFSLSYQADSGSKLRPLEMIKAFQTLGEAEGIKIITINGNSQERKKQFERLLQEGELEDLLFCYVENQTIPIWLTDSGHIPKSPFIDWKVFRYLKQKKVPVGVFYRDIYWKFDELYPLKGWKKKIMKMLYKLEEKFYEKYADDIFLPSEEMFPYVSIKRNKIALPPGGNQQPLTPIRKESACKNGIYVGGIREDTGIPILLDAMEIIHKRNLPFTLTVVCREREFQGLPAEVKQRFTRLGIKVQHLSGMELHQLYYEQDVGFIPFQRSTYNEFAVAFKLFEYLSHNLPVIATECAAQKRIIESGPYGLICKDDPQSMADAIEKMIESHPQYLAEIERTFLMNHSWLARAHTVKNTFLRRAVM